MTPARLWRLAAGTFATLLVLAALLVTALRIAIAYLPAHADTLRAWVEQQTRMRIEYQRLDARLRWYGPEVVLHGVRLLDERGTQTVIAAREGSVGLDLWNFLRTGQLVAGRVRIEQPQVTFVRLADGRIRLLGLAERPLDQPPFDLDRLPAGRVVVEAATVRFRDLLERGPALELGDLSGELRRDRDVVYMEGRADLPEALGSTVDFDLRLKGSLDEREHLDARLDVRAETIHLAGLARFLPANVARPLSGRGPARVVLGMQQGSLVNVRLELGLRNVALALPARQVPPVAAVVVSSRRLETASTGGMPYATVTKDMVARPPVHVPREIRLAVLDGEFHLKRNDATWTFRGEDIVAAMNGRRARQPARVAGSWWGHPATRFALEVDAADVDLAQSWPLVLALAPRSFDRWAGLAPTGRVASLRASASRVRAGMPPTFTVQANVASLAVQPHAGAAGVSGLTATVDGNDRQGTIRLRSTAAVFDWPAWFTAPIALQRAEADLAWRRVADGWTFATRGARLEHAQARATLDGELKLPDSRDSPVLRLDADVSQADIAAAPKFIPMGRLRERTVAWLDRALVGGRLTEGHLAFRGPVRKFPFRHGEGEFLATAETADVTLDFYPGFARLERAAGKVEFRNAAIRAELTSGEVGGIALKHANFSLSDYQVPVLEIAAQAAGDLAPALAFVQQSPLGPRIGDQFMGLRGDGPARYDVKLVLPLVSAESRARLADTWVIPPRDYFVRATLDGVNVALPALRAPVQRAAGVFELHNDDITVPALRGTILDGPFELEGSPGRTSREVTAAVDLSAHGRAAGARLPAFIGLPSAVRMTGSTDWALRGRIERRGIGQWPVKFEVTSDLTGLDVSAPRPFAKPAAEARATRVRVELPGQHVNDVTVETGSARAKLRFADRNGQWRLERGTARFDGQPAALSSQPGLLIAGDWPQFDLGEWLALGDAPASPTPASAASGGRLMDWLGPVDVHLARATVFGFEFDDVVAKLRGENDAWRVMVSSPRAEGVITVPADLARGRPITLEMQRLHLVSVADGAGGRAEGAPQTDPRKLPAITLHAEDFVWQARRFGRLDAFVTRDPRGLTFESLNASAPSFDIVAQGSWYVEPAGTRTRLDAQLTSSDVGAATQQLGYRSTVDARKGRVAADLWWPGGPSGESMKLMNGTLRLALEDGQLRDIEPGAGRVLGLLSVAQLPRRLALDFRDVTDKGLAFNDVKGDFELRAGNAYTQNLLLTGPAVNVGIVGRTGLATEDYDQTMVVSGNTSGPLAMAGALAAGPVVGAGVLVLSQLFKDQLRGLTRVYYHVGGPWSAPVVERVAAPPAEAATAKADPPRAGRAP